LGVYGIAQTPARQSVAEEEYYWKDLPEKGTYWEKLPEKAIPAVRFGLEHAWFGPVYPQEFDVVQAAIVQMVSGKGDFAAALSEAQGALQPETTSESVGAVVDTPQPQSASEQAAVTYFLGSSFTEQELYAVEALAEAFNRDHPDMAVKVESDYVQGDLITEASKRSDCFTTTSWFIDLYQPHKEVLLSLDSLLASEDPEFLQEYSPALLDLDRIEGDLYALPAVVRPPVILYNADLLARRGLQPPANDWAFDDFVNMMTSAASLSEGDRSYGYLWSNDDLFFRGRSVEWIDLNSDPPSVNLDSPEMVSALAWMVELSRSGALLAGDENNDVVSGRVAFWPTIAGRDPGSSNLSVSFQWGVAPYPLTPERTIPPHYEITSHSSLTRPGIHGHVGNGSSSYRLNRMFSWVFQHSVLWRTRRPGKRRLEKPVQRFIDWRWRRLRGSPSCLKDNIS
jgi:ABC-type glycerol-3-phosphate transport system substrate-binding protein